MSTESAQAVGERREVLWPDFDTLSEEQLLWLPAASQASHDVADLVRSAVRDGLSSKQREVVEAYFFEGLSQSEIAQRFGVRQQVVHKRIYGVTRNGRQVGGALRRLRQVLSGVCGP